MNKLELKVKGMVCHGCEGRICNLLSEIEGIKKVKANYKKEEVIVFADKIINQNDIKEKIKDLGFEVIAEEK